jgi:hypothetical protein
MDRCVSTRQSNPVWSKLDHEAKQEFHTSEPAIRFLSSLAGTSSSLQEIRKTIECHGRHRVFSVGHSVSSLIRRVRGHKTLGVIYWLSVLVRHSASTHVYAERLGQTLGVYLFPECQQLSLGKIWIFFLPLGFFFSSHTTCGTPCQNLVIFCICLLHLVN